MDIWRVIGFRKVDFKDEKSESRVTGYSIYVCRPGDSSMVGDEAQKVFVNDQKCTYVPCIGDQINIFYNRFGKIADIQLH